MITYTDLPPSQEAKTVCYIMHNRILRTYSLPFRPVDCFAPSYLRREFAHLLSNHPATCQSRKSALEVGSTTHVGSTHASRQPSDSEVVR